MKDKYFFFAFCGLIVLYAATKIPFMYSFSRNSAASIQISTFMCLWTIYIFPGSVLQQNRQTIMGIYKSLTDTWMWKLWRRPHNSFSGNICLEFSVLCLCSVNTVCFSLKRMAGLVRMYQKCSCWIGLDNHMDNIVLSAESWFKLYLWIIYYQSITNYRK